MNIFSGVGRLTRDPELRLSQTNISIASGTIAINRPFKNAQGEREADFIRFVAFRKTAELVNEHFKKGDELGVTGRIQTRNYENDSGQRVYVTELVVENITFVSGNKNNSQNVQNQGYNQPNPSQSTQHTQNQNGQSQGNVERNPFANADGPIDISSEDLPF
jgi:single-strand DNA-binding protein